MKKLIFLLVLLVGFLTTNGQKKAQIEVKTSAQCEMCAERIEKELKKEDGIKAVSLDVSTQIVTVKYNGIITNEEHIKEMIADLGYDADDYPAAEDAYNKLPGCCKKPENKTEEDKMH